MARTAAAPLALLVFSCLLEAAAGAVAAARPIHRGAPNPTHDLYTAALVANLPKLRAALAAPGCRVDGIGSGGMSALMRAALNDEPRIVAALLEAGASVGLRDPEGGTAWDYADGAGEDTKALLRKALKAAARAADEL